MLNSNTNDNDEDNNNFGLFLAISYHQTIMEK